MFRLVLLSVVLAVASLGTAFACSQPSGGQALENNMIGWINQQRAARGLNQLSVNGKLASTAQGHACDMAERGYFGHQRAGGPDLGKRLKANGFRYRKAAENIAKTRASDVRRVGQIWRDSPDHWANILQTGVTEIGIGIARGGDRTYWVMNVGRSR